MDKATLQKNWKSITAGIFAFSIIMLLLPIYSVVGLVSANVFQLFGESFFCGLLLILAPVAGLVFALAVGKNMPSKQKNWIAIVIYAVGIIMLFVGKAILAGAASSQMGPYSSYINVGSLISLGIGSILTLIVFIVGIVYSIICMNDGDETTAASYTASPAGNRFCQQCGAQVDAGQKFCQSCGAKMEE